MSFIINIIYYIGFIIKYIDCLQVEVPVGPNIERAIINGKEASIEWYPSIVGLMQSSRVRCGGTIIGSDVVLTAAHCIHALPYLSVCAGANYKNCHDGKIYNVKASIVHPEFNSELLDNDFALVQVTEKFQISETVKIARLVSEPIDPGSAVYAIGWGGGEYAGEKLQDIKLKVISKSECKERLPINNITENMLCTFNKHGRDTCDGDSGGPLFYRGQLAGVTSWGIKCGLPYPSMYSDVFHARKWIEENMQKFSSTDADIDLKTTRQQGHLPTDASSRGINEDDDLSSSSSSSEDLENKNVVSTTKHVDFTSPELTLSTTKDAASTTLRSMTTTNIDEDDYLSSSSSLSEDLDAEDKNENVVTTTKHVDLTSPNLTLSTTKDADLTTLRPTLPTTPDPNINEDDDLSSSSSSSEFFDLT